MLQVDISQNLKLLCGFEKSVSEVCRAININRQQFNKYLSGTSQPSPYNLQRICDHFRVQPAELYLPPAEFASRLQFRSGGGSQTRERQANRMLKRAFPGDRRALSRYLGYYLSHFHSFSWQGQILRSLVCVYEQDGMILTKTIERNKDPADDSLFLSKYNGYVSLLGNRIFAVEFQSLARDAIVETILHPAGRSELTLLRGVTFGLSSKHRNPYVSRTVWKYLGRTVDHRSAIKAAGLLPFHSSALDRQVVQILGDQPFPNEQLHYELERQEAPPPS